MKNQGLAEMPDHQPLEKNMDIEDIFNETRSWWNSYAELSTPWPEDQERRDELIAMRRNIAKKRLELTSQMEDTKARKHWQRIFHRDMTK